MAPQKRNIKVVLGIMFWLFIIAFIAVIVKMLVLEIRDRSAFASLEDNRVLKMRSFSAQRGNIYSIDATTGELLLLATDEIRYDVYLDLGKGKVSATGEKFKVDYIISDSIWRSEIDKVSSMLAHRFGKRTASEWKSYLQKNRKKNNRYTPLLSMVSQNNIDYLCKRRNPEQQKGKKQLVFETFRNIIKVKKYKRIYPYDDMARRTIGIEVKEDNGISYNGIDGYYENILAGSKGIRLERNIAKGLWIPEDDTQNIKPKPGRDIITTIDVSLQQLAENALMKCLDSNRAESGTVILMETKTGCVKAMASFTRKKDSTYYESVNIATQSAYEPGSTFKTVTAMMLLDKGLCDTGEMVATGMMEYRGATKPIYDVNKKGRDKDVSFARAMEISSNVGISQLVYNYYGENRNTREQFAKDLQSYFVYQRLHTDIDVEEPMPIIRSSKNMDDMLRMSFGYVTMMTPLQMLTFYNGIANGGKILKPLFVKSIMDNGNIVKQMQPIVIKEKMCKPETLKKIQTILRRVVLYGTGKRLKSASYGIAGKSGTSEMNYHDGKVESKYRKHRASFVGYFPYNDPQYSCIVLISAPEKALTHGGDLAAPVFRELADRVMGFNAQKVEIAENGNIKNDKDKDKKNNYFVDRKREIDAAIMSNVVPDVRGWNMRDAVYVLEKQGLKVGFSGNGIVKSQSIKPKTKITKNIKHIELN